MSNKLDKILAEISAGELIDKITILEIKKIKIGMTLEDVLKTIDRQPVKYGIHPEYALLNTIINYNIWEVAFRYNKQNIITDISYKKTKR